MTSNEIKATVHGALARVSRVLRETLLGKYGLCTAETTHQDRTRHQSLLRNCSEMSAESSNFTTSFCSEQRPQCFQNPEAHRQRTERPKDLKRYLRSPKFTEYRPLREGKAPERSVSPSAKKLHSLSKENERLSAKLEETQCERDCLKAWRESASSAKNQKPPREHNVEKQQLQRSLVVSHCVIKDLVVSAKQFLRATARLQKHLKDKELARFEDAKYKLEFKVKEASEANDLSPTQSPVKTALNRETHKEEGRRQTGTRRGGLEQASAAALVAQAASALESNYEALTARLASTETALSRVKLRMQDLLQHSLEAMTALNSEMDAKTQFPDFHEEKCLLEYTLAQNEAWAAEKTQQLNQEIQDLLLERQECLDSSAGLLEENNRLLACREENTPLLEELAQCKARAVALGTEKLALAEALAHAEFHLQTVSIEKEALSTENKSLLQNRTQQETGAFQQSALLKQRMDQANAQIESILFEKTAMEAAYQEALEQAHAQSSQHQITISSLEAALQEQVDSAAQLRQDIASDSHYKQLTRERQELMDLITLQDTDIEMYKNKLKAPPTATGNHSKGSTTHTKALVTAVVSGVPKLNTALEEQISALLQSLCYSSQELIQIDRARSPWNL